jgi:hypothetical protein
MTEAEWLASEDARAMLTFLRDKQVSGRKYRLYACAAVRQIWHQFDDERSRSAVEVAERLADGEVTRRQLAGSEARDDAQRVQGGATARKTLLRSARMAANDVTFYSEQSPLPALIRCVFRHPSRPPVVIDPAWLSWNDGVVPRVAASVYSERQLPQGTFNQDRLLVLSDALQEAGCEDEEVISHLRGHGPHVRGCWVIDLFDRAGAFIRWGDWSSFSLLPFFRWCPTSVDRAGIG